MTTFSNVMAAVAAAKVACKGCVGITTHISQALRGGGGRYETGERVSKRNAAARGLKIGRRLDTLFQRAAATGGRGASRRVRSIYAAMTRLGIQVVSTQVTVVDRTLNQPHGITTRLDGLGYCKASGAFVVLELKSTQHDYAAHLRCYKKPCSRHPKMLNGEPNSEHTAHQLQTGFGMRAFAGMYNPGRPVEGLVIVSCADARAAFYHVPPRFTGAGLFKTPWGAPRLPPRAVGPLLDLDLADAKIKAVLGRLGNLRAPPRLSADRKVVTARLEGGGCVALAVASGKAQRVKAAARLRRSGGKRATRHLYVAGPEGLALL